MFKGCSHFLLTLLARILSAFRVCFLNIKNWELTQLFFFFFLVSHTHTHTKIFQEINSYQSAISCLLLHISKNYELSLSPIQWHLVLRFCFQKGDKKVGDCSNMNTMYWYLLRKTLVDPIITNCFKIMVLAKHQRWLHFLPC